MKCKNCGAQLKYDIKTQKLVCESCGSIFKLKGHTAQGADYAEKHKQGAANADGQDAEGNKDTMDYYLYTCPSCGAELAGTYDTSAVGFCSYCGGQSVIRSRVTGADRPKFIVPFSKSKQECCKEYMDMVRHIPFVPKELKDEGYISEIRGIYIPYYIYHADTKGHLSLQGSEYHGSYEYVYHVETDFEGGIDVPADASIQMDDDIGNKLLPDDEKDVTEFNEGYMTGFYAEMPDAKPDTYYKSVSDQTEDMLLSTFNRKTSDKIQYKNRPGSPHAKTDVYKPFTTLIPAWFLTYRKGDRVCYSIFSGRKMKWSQQNTYSSVPIAFGPYFITVLLLTAVLTALFSVLPILIPHKLVMWFMSVMSCVSVWLMWGSMKAQAKRLDMANNPLLYKKSSDTSMLGSAFLIILLFGFFQVGPPIFLTISASVMGAILGDFIVFAISAVAITASLVPFIMSLKMTSAHKEEMSAGSITLMFFATVAASIFSGISALVYMPDTWFYAAMVIVLGVMIVAMFGIYKQYNLQCMRALPHFTREGGDNRVKG